MDPLEIAGIVFGVISAFGGFIALMVGIITNTKKFKDWHHDRMNREANLDILASNMDTIQDLVQKSGSITELTEEMNDIDSKLRRALCENKRQDRQIRDSLQERKLLMMGLIAVFDWTIKNGANGTIHKAYDELRSYQYHRSHIYEDFSETEEDDK